MSASVLFLGLISQERNPLISCLGGYKSSSQNLRSAVVRQSFPRQVDKKSRGPGQRGLEFSRRKKGQTFIPPLQSLALYNNNVSCLTEKAMAPHSSTLAWKIPWMEEPGRLQSMGSLRVRHD